MPFHLRLCCIGYIQKLIDYTLEFRVAINTNLVRNGLILVHKRSAAFHLSIVHHSCGILSFILNLVAQKVVLLYHTIPVNVPRNLKWKKYKTHYNGYFKPFCPYYRAVLLVLHDKVCEQVITIIVQK